MATSRDRRGRRAPRLLGLGVAAIRAGRPCPAPACDGAACACRPQRGRVTQPRRAHDRALTVGAWLDGAAARGGHTCCGVAQIVRARRPDVAVLTTTMHGLLGQVGPALRAIKSARPDCRTVVGGQAYWELSSAAADFGADSLALDARALHQHVQAPA